MAAYSEEEFLWKLEITIFLVLAKKYRLCKEWEINRVYKKGKRIHSPFFTLRIFQRFTQHGALSSNAARATVVVSKKYDKRAVQRNALKRKFREAARGFVISLRKPLDIIILPKVQAGNASFHQIYKEVERCFDII